MYEKTLTRSKKTQRSSSIKKQDVASNPAEDMKEIRQFMNNLMIEIKQIRADQQEYRSEINTLKKENVNLREEIKELNTKLEKIYYIEEKIESYERKNKRNNIIISGLKVDVNKERAKDEIEKFVQKNLNVQIKAKNVNKINNKRCVIELESFEKKLEVMKNKSKLKSIEGDKIYIDNDLTKKEIQIQKKIKEIANEERLNQKQVKIGHQKIFIEKELYIWNRKNDKLVKVETQNKDKAKNDQ